jgi:hypothetical protein
VAGPADSGVDKQPVTEAALRTMADGTGQSDTTEMLLFELTTAAILAP